MDAITHRGAALRTNSLGRHATPWYAANTAILASTPIQQGSSVHAAAYSAGIGVLTASPATISGTSAAINNFNLQRHLLSRAILRRFRADAALSWQEAVAA